MPTFTILSHAWTMTQHRAKPVLKPFVWTLAMLLGVVGQMWAADIHVPSVQPTIAAAIAVANPGDVIIVAAGTYTEELNLNKAITIQGANVGISAGAVPGTRGAETIIDGGFIVSAAATLNGLQIINGRTSGSFKVGVAVAASGVSILNCIIQDVGMVPLTAQSDGISTQPGNNNLTLTNSKIFNNWRGIYLNPGSGHTFTGNLIDANNGVGVGIGSDGQSNLTLTGNIISNHTLEGWGASAVGANVVAENNQFLSNGVSVAHYGGSAIDASPNYWGSANPNWGPMSPNFSGNVTYDPWWADVAMTMLESNLPVKNISVNTFHATIQEAIDAAINGHIIEAEPGNYPENITVNKNLEIRGANDGIDPNTGIRGAESIILDGKISILGANTVIIDGFHIYQTNTTTPVSLGGATTANIQYCIIERFGVATGSTVRGIEISNGAGAKTIKNNKISGDVSGGLFGGHKTWNSGMFINGPASVVNLQDNVFENCRTAINIDDMGVGITLSGNIFQNSGTYISFGGTNPTTGSYTLGANEYKTLVSTLVNLSNVTTAFRLDISAGTYNGTSFGALPLATLFGIESTMFHRGRSSRNGLVTYVANNQYVIPVNPSIQLAIDYAVAGHTINIADGTYTQRLVVNKSLTLDGQSQAGTILNGTGLGNGRGIAINNAVTSVTVQDLTVQNFSGANGNTHAGIYAIGGNDDLTVENVTIQNNVGGSGFYANGPVDNVTLDYVTSSGHTTSARGIVIWNGLKSNITITNCTVFNNNCCGIELQDGTCSAVTMNNNTVYDNEDNGMSAVGLNGSVGPSTISNNTITNCGRFGIEIKNPDGSATVSGNIVTGPTTTPTSPTNVLKDFAGIALMRRGVLAGNVDVPTGVTVTGNTVTGYVQPSVSDGFGIVVEGTHHLVTGNTVTGNDVGIQQQAGHLPYPGDGNDANVADQYFGRGNSPTTGCNAIYDNTLSNTVDTREVGGPFNAGFVTNFITNATYCSIQDAINAASPGHTLLVSPGTYTENVIINKSLTIEGANANIACGSRGAESIVAPASGVPFTVSVGTNGVTINGFEITAPTAPNAIVCGNTSDLTIKYNNIHDIYLSPASGSHVHAINYTVPDSPDRQNVVISDNCLSNIGNFDNHQRSTSAIGILQGGSLGNLTNLTIERNSITNIKAKKLDWVTLGGRIAYGIIVNVGGNANFPTNGKVFNAIIRQNEISNLEGFIATGIGLEGNTQNAIVENNSVSYLKGYKVDVRAGGGYDLSALKFENNRYVSTCTVQNNSFDVSTFTHNVTPGLGYAVSNYVPTANGGTATLSCNWLGSADYTEIVDNALLDGKIFNKDNCATNFVPFLVDDTDSAPAIGFQPAANACSGCIGGGNVVNTTTNLLYCSIQEAIVAATSGDRLNVKTGIYDEDVDATSKNIIFAPGNSPGCVTINGNYTLNSGDVLEMEIEGTMACAQHDQFIVNGVVTLNGATLTLIPSMFLATDLDVITLILNDGADAVVGKFAQGNFATDGQNTYYINYKGGDGNDVVLTKCCGALVDLGIFTTIVAPVDNPPMQKDVLAGHKLVIRAKPTKDMVNAIYTQGTFTIRTPTNIGLIDIEGDSVHSSFGYVQIGMKQTIGGYDYFVFNFENGNPAPLNWLEGVEYDLLTLTYSCAVGAQMFELVTNPTDPNAPVSGKFYQEINGETNPGAQGVFYTPSTTGPGVLTISATSNSPVCETMGIDLNSTTSNGSPAYIYTWTGPDSYTNTVADPAPFVAGLASAGIYQVSVTDGNGCTATGTTTVVVPATTACVQNETNNPDNYYPTIKQAIDAPLTIAGDVLNVPAGTWPENVNVNKAVTLNGANEGIPCDGTRSAESIIQWGTGTAVTISSDGVTIDGFQIEGTTGVSSTGFNKASILNNKVNALEVGIGSVLLATSAMNPYSIRDNCIDFPAQAFDQQVFSANPTLSAAQAPGAWYTDRYAPAGFIAASFGGGSRLKHTISAADCQTCRPGSFNTAFYNTQGRKYDVAGTTNLSVQLFVPSAWATTNERMAGVWGTGSPSNGTFAIIEFTSDGGNPRFRGWSSFTGWIDMGLPSGFAYDSWYTLNIGVLNNEYVYAVGDLLLSVSAGTDVSLSNVILQGHNTLAGVTYDIYWDNLNTHGSDDTQTAPTVGIALAAASGTDDVTVQDNNVSDAFYGYLLSGVTTTPRTTVTGGTYTNLLQGIAVVNTLDGVNYAPSTVGVEDVNFESFGGNYPNIPAANFHAGIYGFTGGANAAHNVDILVNNVTLKNTGKTSQASAGLYLADFSSGAGNRLNAIVTLSNIEDNLNRGVQVRGANATATVNTSHILGNGADPFGAGGNHGYGVYAGVGSTVTLNNNFIENPSVQVSDNVTALYEGVAPASTIIAGSNSIVRNGNGLLANTTTGTINGATNCNWWGDANPNVFDEFILGSVTYAPYLPSGVDAGGDPTNGFQPNVACLGLTDFYVNDNSTVGDLITFAVGLDGPATRGTAHRPYRHINAAIGAASSGVGHTVRVDIGNYNDEQVLVNKGLTILGTTGAPAARPVVDYTGTVSGKPTLFDVSADGVTIDNIGFNVDLSKLKSAIIVSGATIDNIEVVDNQIDAYGTPVAGNYSDRNAVSINYGGNTNYRVASGGVNSITFTGNTVNGSLPASFFRAGVAVDEGGGTFTDNTLQTINQDIVVRFANNGDVTISDNTLNGGGVELSDNNAGAGTFTVTNNDFDGTMSNIAVTPRTAVLRLKNNQQNKVTTVSGNTFSNHLWAISEENYKNVTVDDNVFTPLAGSTDFLHVGVNTKSISSNSNTIVQTTINGIFTNNVFNGSGTPGGTGIAFFNHDSDADDIGTFTVGTLGNENEFNSNIAVFAHLDDQFGSTDPATFPTNYPDGGGWLTTMACWDKDVDLTNNTFDVGAGQQLPLDMNNAQRVALEAKLYHKPDNSCLGKFFQTVEVMARVFLQGPYDPADGPNGRMIDALRTITTGMSPFPLAQPHAAINTAFPGSFVEVSNAGSETITTTVRDVSDANNSIVDWVWLELRDKNNSNTTLFTRSALLQRDGDIVDLDGTSEVAFPNAYQDQYYLMVRHRNHLAAMTAAPINFSNMPFVDFTTSAQATFGATPTSARRLIKTGIYGLWAGNTFPKDTPGSGGAFRLLYNGSNNDRAPILNRVGNSTPLNVVDGYYLEDVNMNGQVKYSGSNNDRVIILNNVGASTPLNFITQEPNN
jgi:hypothetical protein